MNYCSNCGSEQINFDIPHGDNRARYICHQCNAIHYQNPKMVVGCLPVFEDKILICRRAIEPCYGLWNLPAGYLENNETVEEGAARETWEEARANVKIIKLHCIYNLPHINQVYLHFLAHLKNDRIACGSESLEVKLFDVYDIPWKQLAFSSSKFALEKYIEFKESYQGVHMGTYQAD
ncbi:ADP-ribose pyrophosphatase YjhB (NUDIX family) [Catalinimonas alkaloidigena]|uniref:NUDIX hydrolase n=1 Tax=Catalinimonas alkaloidigena TaxID=1075417 RepID=UPI0024051D9B|nr:NUDIX hydrolase [Catalinimonas alkaloidigena]MDF9798233.1 ADP-ribose pyrophosphatase YjhB (NUDIX family) [Catalinimonas alkaloidigena]